MSHRRRRAPMRRLGLVAVIGLMAGLIAAHPAGATMFLKSEAYSGEEHLSIDGFCGLESVSLDVVFSGRVHVREGTGKQDGVFFLHDNFSVVETITNNENGRFLTASHDGLFKDLRATRVDGNIFEFVSHEVGQPFVVRDMDGNVVVRDRGALTFTYLFDTLGDDVPGGVFVEELDVRVSGPHPIFSLAPGEECPTVLALIG